MPWRVLLDPDVRAFMHLHQDTDIPALALKKSPCADWPYALILDQIKVRQKAKIKAPDLYDTDGFIFPRACVFEQSSSTACARYKALLMAGDSFVDLSAGAGADSFAFAPHFKHITLIERDHETAELLRHNMAAIANQRGFSQDFHVLEMAAEDYVSQMGAVDAIYIDPQRRENGKKGLFDFKNCTPDILNLIPMLREKTNKIMVKASPVLDILQGIRTLRFVSHVFVVEWQGECKEVLYLLDFLNAAPQDQVGIRAVQIDDAGGMRRALDFTLSQEAGAQASYAMPLRYLYEPSPAFQKAGAFHLMAQVYGVSKLHPLSHLYTANELRADFPGKVYEVMDVIAPRKANLTIKAGELVLRNFSGTAEALRKTLGLKEGDQHRVFATTLCNQEKKLIITKKCA